MPLRTEHLVRKNAGLVRLARSWGALGLLLVLAISGGGGSAQAGPRAPVPEKPFQMPGRLVGTATHFEIKDSKFLNINLDSSRAINLTVESVPEMIIMRIGVAANTPSTAMTISGLNPSTTYHKYEDSHRNHVAFTSDPKGRYTWTQNLSGPHLVFIKPRESTKYIGGPNGQDCGTIGIWNAGSQTCTLTTNVSETIEVVSNGVTLDGAGHKLTPASSCNGFGVYLAGRSGTTVRNLGINQFSIGIFLWQSNGNRLERNVVTASCGDGIVLDTSNSNSLIGNTATNDNYGIFLQSSHSNTLTDNLVASNTGVGVYMGLSNGNSLSSSFVGINNYGIVVNDHSRINKLTCNTVRWNSQGIGFYLGSKTGTVSENNLGDNKVQAFADLSSPNSFNLSAANSGNYWRNPPSGYVSPVIFSGGTDNKPLQNPRNCKTFLHCPPWSGQPQADYRVDLSTGNSQQFIADPLTTPAKVDPHWHVPSNAPPGYTGDAYSVAALGYAPPPQVYWIGSPYAPVGPGQQANWISTGTGAAAGENAGGVNKPIGTYEYATRNIPAFNGPGTLTINGIAADDTADLYLDGTLILSGSNFVLLLPFKPLSVPVTTPGAHVLTAKLANVGGGLSGLVVLAEFCPTPKPCVFGLGMIAASFTYPRRITLAQTFTPTTDGSLTEITHRLQSGTGSVTSYDLLVTTTTSAGLPSWTGGPYNTPNILFKATGVTVFASSNLNAVIKIPSGQRPCLTAGTRYAIILIPGSPTTGNMQWQGNTDPNSYPSGSAYELNGTIWTVPAVGPKDHGFKVDGLCPCTE